MPSVVAAPRGLKALGWVTLIGAATSVLARGGQRDWHSGDIRALIAGLPGISRCFGAHVITACNAHGGGVSAFPLIQIVPAYLLHELGLSPAANESSLTWLNALVTVLFCAVVLRWCHRRGGVSLAVLGGLLLIPGMLIPYTAQSFGEPLATAAFGCMCLAALRTDRTSPWLIPLSFVATVSKDTAAPFVILLALAGIAMSGSTSKIARRSVRSLAIGVGVGLLCAAAFNVFRYGGVTDTAYLQYPPSTPGMVGNSTLGLLVSPNGGISWFWPGTIIAAVVLAVTLARGTRSELDPRRVRVAAALGLVALAGSIVVLAFWWQPYGWYAWGPRLLMPVAPAIIILALSMLSSHQITRYWLSPSGAIALAVIAVLVVAPSVGVVFNWHAYTAQVTSTWKQLPECRPRHGTPYKRSLVEHCLRFSAWETKDMNLRKAVPATMGGHRWYWGTFIVAAASISIWAGIGCKSSRGSRALRSRPSVADNADYTPLDTIVGQGTS
jgi:hypothetical protein